MPTKKGGKNEWESSITGEMPILHGQSSILFLEKKIGHNMIH